MNTVMRKTLMLGTVLLFASGAAQANINASLKRVCVNAQTDGSQQAEKTESTQQKRYEARLASFYKGISCDGKALLTHKIDKPKQGVGTIAERRLLK